MKDLIKLKKCISSEDFNDRMYAVEEFSKVKPRDAIEVLVPLLKHERSEVRNTVALALHDIKSEAVIEPLWEAIRVPENENDRGTLVYALEGQDCSKHFLDLLELALYGNLEVQNQSLSILEEQAFNLTIDDVNKAKEMVKKYLTSDSKCPDKNDLINGLNDMISSFEEAL